jgi:hypothetical protein
MCDTPSKLPSGELVACRKCWQCRNNRINDWVGRCIAESETATASHSITLTYGRDEEGNEDHLRAAVLTYSDVQKYFKLLRRRGYPCKYFAVGEYGTTKGRAHWHLMVYWQGPVPPHEEAVRFQEQHWPHGYSFWEKPTPAAVRYVCKYITKDLDNAQRQGHLAMSKKPPLGHAYFVGLAGRYVDQGIAPLEPYYWFSHVRGEDGRPEKFYLSGVSLDNFCQSFLEQWAARRGGHPPISSMLEAYCDRMARVDKPLLAEVMPQRVNPFYVSPGKAVSYYVQGEKTWQRKTATETNRETTGLRPDGSPLSQGADGYMKASTGT